MPFAIGEVELSDVTINKLVQRQQSWRNISRITSLQSQSPIILYEDFEDTTSVAPMVQGTGSSLGGRWWTSGIPAGGTIERSLNRSYSGKASLHFKYTTSGANPLAGRAFYGPDRISAEAFFAYNVNMQTVNDGQAFFMSLYFSTAAGISLFRLEYRPHMKQFLFWSATVPTQPALIEDWGAPIALGQPNRGWNMRPYDGVNNTAVEAEGWHNMKLYVDRSLSAGVGQYIGCSIDHSYFNLSPNTPGAPGGGIVGAGKQWGIVLSLVSDSNALTAHGYWDAITIRDETNAILPTASTPNGLDSNGLGVPIII